MVLFDGLDEVRQEQEQRLRLSHLLRDFARKYDSCQCLITCRVAASDYHFEGFQDMEIADFTDEQVTRYTQKWFGDATGEDQEETLFTTFQTELEKGDNRRLRELCNSPLLLSMLCLHFQKTMRLPRTRAELYERAIRAFLEYEWDAWRKIQREQVFTRELSPQRIEWLLSNIAYNSFVLGQYAFDERNLGREIARQIANLPSTPDALDIDGSALLKELEAHHSLLVERAVGIHSFSHLTFHEYFTARYIVENRASGTLNQLVKHQNLLDSRWREVFLLVISMLPNAQPFFIDMQNVIDKAICEEQKLNALLKWADKKTVASNVLRKQRVDVRLAYIFLGIDIDLDLSHSFELALIGTLASSLINEQDFAKLNSFDVALTLAFDLAFSLMLADDLPAMIDKAHKNTINLTRALSLEVGIDYAQLYGWQVAMIFARTRYFDELIDQRAQYTDFLAKISTISSELNDTLLTTKLMNLTPPTSQADQATWENFANTLLSIMHTHRDLDKQWDLNKEQVDTLYNYFQATELLVQCLKLAVVSDRAAIEARILAPPV